MLRSQSGAHAGAWLHAAPHEPGLALDPARMQVALRRRLRLPLPLRPAICGAARRPGCGGRVDSFGDHEAACPQAGRLLRRAKPVERAWIRVAREGVGANGQVVGQQWLANTTAPGVRPDDRRRLDLVVYGAAARGETLCCDATIVSPLRRNGAPRPHAADTDGVALAQARRLKERTYPELDGGGTRLVVLGCEVGGCWNDEARRFVSRLAHLRAAQAPPLLRHAVRASFMRRWWGLLSVAVQDALAATTLGLPLGPLSGCAPASAPYDADVVTLHGTATTPCRLPLRA